VIEDGAIAESGIILATYKINAQGIARFENLFYNTM
jgi:hypothetical protein